MMAMTDERQRQQRAKNRALLAVLAGLALLFYLMALVKMGAF
jgi:hypothetical protein